MDKTENTKLRKTKILKEITRSDVSYLLQRLKKECTSHIILKNLKKILTIWCGGSNKRWQIEIRQRFDLKELNCQKGALGRFSQRLV